MAPSDQNQTLAALEAGRPNDLADGTDRVLLSYALKLTHTPGSIEQADVDALRRVGLDDLAIHDLCAIVAYFAFVNRVADGLGVELESPE
jgi:uncharacterized peroxidase-related enzyme